MLEEWLPKHLHRPTTSSLSKSIARLSRRSSGRLSPLPPSGGLSLLCPMADGRSKKVQDSLRARRRSDGPVAMAGASYFEAIRLVFVEESGYNTSMTRLKARAPKGKRAYGKVPRNLKARTLP